MTQRLVLLAAAAAVLIAPTLASAGGDKIDLVAGGFVCDQRDQFCYDQRGANVAKTRQMFGQYAAEIMQRKLDKKDEWGTRKFTLSNGVRCSVVNRACKHDHGDGDRAKKITKHLFGGR